MKTLKLRWKIHCINFDVVTAHEFYCFSYERKKNPNQYTKSKRERNAQQKN